MKYLSHRCLLATLCLSIATLTAVTLADEAEVPASERLKNDQEAVSGRYARFERLLSQMADMLGHEDPERAELLRRAISKGREQAIASELDAIADSLSESDFGAAREKQAAVTTSLEGLLKLLQSEDRRSSVEKERERLTGILKGVRNTLSQERAARGAAQNSTAPSNAAQAQQKALDRANGILKDIESHDDSAQDESSQGQSDESDGESSSDSDGSNDNSEGNNSEDTQQDSSSDNQGSSDNESQNGKEQNSDSESGSQSEGNPSDTEPGSRNSDSESSQQNGGQSSKGQQSQSGQPQGSQQNLSPEDSEQQTPGRENLEAARERMQEALDQLKQQQREGAVDKQDEAIAQLQKAVRELEKTLKQLREEEKEMVLASLEARFQRLLAQQTEIYNGTVELSAKPRDEWLDNSVSRCRELSQDEADLAQECSLTTALLREDGTSVSILVAVEDIEADMKNVANRLQKTQVGDLTQSIETDIIESLNELIKTTQTEMEEMKSQQQQPQQQSGEQQKPKLVQLMQEIRVLRSLQVRVNRRTQRIHDLLGEQPEDITDLNSQLNDLAGRQQRLRESAVELAKQIQKEQR